MQSQIHTNTGYVVQTSRNWWIASQQQQSQPMHTQAMVAVDTSPQLQWIAYIITVASDV